MVLSTVVVVLLVLVGYLNNTILAGTMSGCLISAQEERRQANEGVNEREDEEGLLQMNHWRLLPQLYSHKTTTCPI